MAGGQSQQRTNACAIVQVQDRRYQPYRKRSSALYPRWLTCKLLCLEYPLFECDAPANPCGYQLLLQGQNLCKYMSLSSQGSTETRSQAKGTLGLALL